MAFTVNDLRDSLEILRTMPEWKDALRRELLGEEILSLPGLTRELTKAIEENNKRLSRVERDIEVLKRDVANLKGDSLEHKYRERSFVYFRRILRKPRVLTDSELDDLEEISRLDAVVRGQRITDDSPAYLAVEVSTKIDVHDVERAARRAALLGKIPSVVAVPVVAGEQIAV